MESTWIKNPSTSQMILFSLLWLLGIFLLALTMTNFFTESVFSGKYLMLGFLMLGSTLTTIKVHINYWQKR